MKKVIFITGMLCTQMCVAQSNNTDSLLNLLNHHQKDDTALLLQPFVENSIWNGIADKQGAGKILIHLKKGGEMINCIVEDDGIRLQNVEDETGGKKSLRMKIAVARIEYTQEN